MLAMLAPILLFGASRVIFFLSVHKLLLRTLYRNLQHLSSPHGSDSSHNTPLPESDFEIEELPTTANRHAAKTKRTISLSSSSSMLAFELCLSECLMMFFLLMCQGIDLIEPRTRWIQWIMSLFLLMSDILLLTPICLSVVLSVGSNQNQGFRLNLRVVALSVAPVFAYLFLFSYIPLPPALSGPNTSFTDAALARLIVVGTVILGVLSGFGAISYAWEYIPKLKSSRQNMPGLKDVSSAEQALATLRRDMEAKRKELQHRQPQTEGSWFSRVVSSKFRGDEDLQELQGFEALEIEMAQNLETLRDLQQNAQFAQTFQGKVFHLAGRLFAIYCIFRIISATINVFTPTFLQTRPTSNSSVSFPDVITRLIAFAASSRIEAEHIAQLSRQISLALVGAIILCSIRTVLRGVTRMLRITSRNLGANLMLLILTQLMGMYFLSTIVQLRTLFPPLTMRTPTPATETTIDTTLGQPLGDEDSSNLFLTIPEYEVFGTLFDRSFLVASGASVAFRWLGERVGGIGSED